MSKILKALQVVCAGLICGAAVRAWCLAIMCFFKHQWDFGSVLVVIGVWAICIFIWAVELMLEDRE